MTRLNFLVLIVIMVSCNNQDNETDAISMNESSNDSLSKVDTSFKKSIKMKPPLSINLTSYKIVDSTTKTIKAHFDFNDFSNEGGEGFAYYDKLTRKISKSLIILYGERNRTEIEYNFSDSRINATEREYNYLESIDQIKSDSDIKLDTIINYYLAYKVGKDLNQIYNEFRKIVPLKLE